MMTRIQMVTITCAIYNMWELGLNLIRRSTTSKRQFLGSTLVRRDENKPSTPFIPCQIVKIFSIVHEHQWSLQLLEPSDICLSPLELKRDQ